LSPDYRATAPVAVVDLLRVTLLVGRFRRKRRCRLRIVGRPARLPPLLWVGPGVRVAPLAGARGNRGQRLSACG
jgi:hypothetical protein